MSDRVQVGDAPNLSRFLPQVLEGDHYLSTWSSPEAFSRHLKSLDTSKNWCDSGREDGNEQWMGTKTFDEALTLAHEGWKEGVDKVYKLRDLIAARNPVNKLPVEYGIAGTVPSIPRAVAGNPLNMRKPVDANSRKRPIITLVTNMTANCGVDEKMITNRAAVMASIIDRIESKGFACEVVTTAMTKGRYGKTGKEAFHSATMVTVKEAGMPVDVGRLAFGLGHGSMFRRLIFADWASAAVNKTNLGYGLGQCIEPEVGELPLENVYILPSAGKNCKLFKDDEIASTEGLKFILSVLEQQGCPAFTNKKVSAHELAQDVPEEPDDYEDYDDDF